MTPFGERTLEHQLTSMLTSSDASSSASDVPPAAPPSPRAVAEPQGQGAFGPAGGSLADANPDDGTDQQLFFVMSYSDFDKLAHGPRGHEGKHTLRIYRFLPDGSLVLLHVSGEGGRVINPAFSRFHPTSISRAAPCVLNVFYTCTEDIEENGQILAYEIHSDGSLTEIGHVDAGGTSTCYLTIDRDQRNLIAVNYWDSSLVVVPLSRETGAFLGPIQSVYDPRRGRAVRAAAKKHGGVNHSMNDESTIAQRQVDPHSHALVLDPFEGCVAYVPDLGKDLIREFFYDERAGKIETELNVLPSGLSTGKPDGPRYIEFHPRFNVAYVVNELSSTVSFPFSRSGARFVCLHAAFVHRRSVAAPKVAVFSIDRELLAEISRAAKLGMPMDQFKGRSTMRLIQSIKTVPSAFPTTMNTCGRISVHQSGRFVIVSNRGHESIAVFRAKQGSGAKGRPTRGALTQVGFFHTRGETPRHFKFDHTGQFLIVAHQDSDTIAVFSFNLTSGEIKYTGNEYRVPSPNFICCCPMTDRGSDDDANEASEKVGYTRPRRRT
ncbi:hypothetical protein ACHAWF_017673 [Thalassiosira exigua]